MKSTISILTIMMLLSFDLQSQVNYQGGLMIQGVQLLQDSKDPNAYYYLPPYPRISMKADSSYEFLFIKYVGGEEDQNGGLFHILLEYTLNPEEVSSLAKALKKKIPGAYLKGQVPLMETMEKGASAGGSFQLISSVLNGQKDFAQQVAHSGHAPLFPGAKAAIAARLDQKGATLLWNSFLSPTSDVSVTLKAYYEAKAPAYHARVSASLRTIRKFFLQAPEKRPLNYSRELIRTLVDSLHQERSLNIEITDGSPGSASSQKMEEILTMVTSKLTDQLFEPVLVPARDSGETRPDWQSELAPGSGFFPTIGYQLRDTQYIRQDTFSFNLTRSSIIRVPVVTAGNLGGIFTRLKDDPSYYRVVDLNDPAYQQKEVYLQIDGAYIASFKEVVNSAAVDIRKKRDDQHDFTETIHFNADAFENNKMLQTIRYSRLEEEQTWPDYEYRISWSLQGIDTLIRIPANAGEWIKSSDAFLNLRPPFEKTVVEIDADRTQFSQNDIHSCQIRIGSKLAGRTKILRRIVLRAGDADNSQQITLYHDPGAMLAYEITWYGAGGQQKDPPGILEDQYLYLTAPKKDPGFGQH